MSEQKAISIIIKALNEEARIGACIESAMRAIRGLDGEIILADSGSTDRTVEIATRYPVTIVQLADRNMRRCGIGPQLGYQFARGSCVYVLDGDMELDPDFLHEGIRALEADPGLAGVAGLVEEVSTANIQFRGRRERNLEGTPGPARWLDMGGLYRRSALQEIGYLSNRNLHACEEQELGLRLAAAGWRMARLSVRGVIHYGHTDPTFALQLKRWRSGYLLGPGEVLRSSLGSPWLTEVLRIHRHLIVTLGLWLLLLIGVLSIPLTGPWALSVWGALLAALLVQRTVKYKSLRDAVAILALWHMDALALLRGFLRSQANPRERIEAVVIAGQPVGRRRSA